ncbi:unnamed protein product [Caenorhabditis nigoni]
MDAHKNYLIEKSKKITMPTEKDAELTAKYMFTNDTFILDMCLNCVKKNRKSEIVNVDDEHQSFNVTLCRICRSNFNAQRTRRFFKYEVPCFKRDYEGELKKKKEVSPIHEIVE